MRKYFASIFIKDISEHIDINSNLKIIDVGGSRGEFSKFLGENFNCDVINLEPFEQDHVGKQCMLKHTICHLKQIVLI